MRRFALALLHHCRGRKSPRSTVLTKSHLERRKAWSPSAIMAEKHEPVSVAKDGAYARKMLLAAQDTCWKPMAPYSWPAKCGHSHFNHQRDAGQESDSDLHDGANAYNGQLVASVLHFPTSLPGGILPPRVRRGDARKRCDHFRKLLVSPWLIVIITMVIGWIPSQTKPHESSSGDASRASPGAGSGSKTSITLAEYMVRFNVPQQNVDLVWVKTGGTTVQRGGKMYHYIARKTNVGVYAGYASMHDSSTHRYCERPTAKIDTQRTVGKPLMASGACPNWGKIIAFTDNSGEKLNTERWKNEIHDNVMPHSTAGCALHAERGASENPKKNEGMAMYAGYMTACPFNDAVYRDDMLPDQEYDPTVCNFVTTSNKLWFLDTTAPSKGKPFTPYAFHGRGGHLGYDYEGTTKHTGCPPYSPPKTTSPMKDASWLTDPFTCVNLSRCTSHCWPFADGQPCYRSLPAIYNLKTKECLLLGYQTQFFQKKSCAGSPTGDTNKFYCIIPVKTSQTSSYVYLTSHTRPDFETQCPPREALLNVQWGRIYRNNYCQPLPEVEVVENTTAEKCGQAVFGKSSSDDPALQLPGLHWGTFTTTKCPQMSQNCRTTATGRCTLHRQPPECLLKRDGSISYTSLTAIDPLIAKPPEQVAVLPSEPSDPCANVDCGANGTCSEGKCNCNEGWGGERCETPIPVPFCKEVICQNQGYCDEKTRKCVCGKCYEGKECEVKIAKCCERNTDCGINEECDSLSSLCVCKPGYMGTNCMPEEDRCPEHACNDAGVCDPRTGECTCYPCFFGRVCSEHTANCCVHDEECYFPRGECDPESHLCKCKDGFGGPDCQSLEDAYCRTWCVPGGHLKENFSDCKGVDCLFLCCEFASECSSSEDDEECYQTRMELADAGCCLGKSETGNVVVYATAGGIAALVLVVAAGGAVVMYRRKSGRPPVAEPYVEFEKGTSARDDEPPVEEAIDVTFDDFRSYPEDQKTVSKGIISTTWES